MFEELANLPLYLDFEISALLLVSALVLLIFVCYQLTISKQLFKNILLMSLFSMLISISYLLMDAPDVAMTEVALGSCLSTCVLLNFIKMVDNEDKNRIRLNNKASASILSITIVSVLTWAGFELPTFGAADSPVHQNVSKYYLKNTYSDTGLPAPVTAILASYRGFDTLGETTVILIAGVGVLLVLSLNYKKNNAKDV